MLTPASIKAMTVEDLKRELRSRSASTTGKKAELAERLQSLVDAPQPSEEMEEQPSQPANSVESNEASEVAAESSQVVAEEAALQPAAEQLPPASSPEVPSAGDTQAPAESDAPRDLDEVSPSNRAVEAETLQEMAADHEAAPSAETYSAQQPVSPDNPVPSHPANEGAGPESDDVMAATATSDRGSWKDRLKQNIIKKREALCTPHVRIDNFQRPLNLKAMLRWLSDLLEFEVAEDKVWLHVIKTHCYIDFDTIEQAKLCIARVTGQRYPSSSTADLVASHSKVSAVEAPSHPEASMKPGEWKNMKPAEAEAGVEEVRMEADPPADSGTSSGKRKASEAKDTVRSGESDQPTQKTREEVSSADVGAEPKKRRVETPSHGPALDVLFRKTLTKPPLYWLPVTPEVAQRRQQQEQQQGGSNAK